MSHYNHLTIKEREKLMSFRAKGFSITQIAQELGRHKSTISRELRRNSKEEDYSPSAAQDNYKQRRQHCKAQKKLSNADLYQFVKDKFLVHQWSPEEISGRLKYESGNQCISTTTIYRAIYAGLFDTEDQKRSKGNRGAIRKLRHHGKTRHTKGYQENRGKIKISHEICERPICANERKRIGDWEADTVVGKRDKACLLTLVDRKSRFLLSAKANAKRSLDVNKTMISCLKGEIVQTITPDRGKEFAKHHLVTEELDGVQFYFPLPHHPWQRGTNENTNGLLREYFPHGKDLTDIDDAYIQSKVDELNKRPRKCLGWKTPYEVYYSVSLHFP